MSDKLLKIKEAANLIGVNPETLRRWDKKGIVNAIKVGKRGDRRYKSSDIQKFIKDKPFKREDSQKKGATGEDILYELLDKVLKEWGFTIVELRSQRGSSQHGKDNISRWRGTLNSADTLFEWSFEAKHYGKSDKAREIDKEKILSKLVQVYHSKVPMDCWCIFSPFSYVDNEVRELVDSSYSGKTYPFRIVLWTVNENIEELIKCFPDLYKRVYERSANLSVEERKKILDSWKKTLIEKTNEGKLLHSKTENNQVQTTQLSSTIAKELKKELNKEGVELSLTSSRSPGKVPQLKAEMAIVNEEIDKVLPLLEINPQESLTKLFLVLGKIEDKQGFAHEKARVYNNIGVAFNVQKETDKAIEFFKKAITTEDNFVVALANLAAAYITKGELTNDKVIIENQLKKAGEIIIPLWNQYSATSPTNVLQVYMRYIRTQDGLEGLKEFIKIQLEKGAVGKLFSTNATLAFIVGSTYLETHEPELAIKYAKIACDLEKKDPEILFLRGRAYMSLAIKENAPTSTSYWKDIVPVFSKKDNLKKAIKDFDETMDLAVNMDIKYMFPQIYFLQRMARIWMGEYDEAVPPVDMSEMKDQKQFLEFVDAFHNRDYEHSYSLLKDLEEFKSMPYEEKFRIERAFLFFGQPEISMRLLDSIRDEAVKNEDYLYWIDCSVVSTLLGDKNQAIFAATKAREVAKGKGRKMVLSHYGAVILRFADEKEGDRVIEGALAFEKEFPDVKILTPYNFDLEKDKIIGMIKERQKWVQNIKKIYKNNPIPSYYLQETFKQPYISVWSGRDPEMPLEFSISSETFLKELADNFSSAKKIVFDYLSLLTLSKLNLLSVLDKLLPEMEITLSLFDKIQNELLKKENPYLRKLWDFLRKSKIIKIVEKIKPAKLQSSKMTNIFEPWLIDTIMLTKQKNARMATDDFRLLRFLKSEDILSINSWIILQKAKENKLIDSNMYSRNIGKLAECFYTFISFNGDDLFEIVFEDDFKLTARSYHLINQIFLHGSGLISFAQVFTKFLMRLWRPGNVIDDKIYWLNYLTGIFAELLKKSYEGTWNSQEVLDVAPYFGAIWRTIISNSSDEEIIALQSKFPDLMNEDTLSNLKVKIEGLIKARIELVKNP